MREQEIIEIKNETKRKLNILDNKINNILRKLYVDLATLRLRYFEKPYEYNSIKKKRKLRILANEIERLKEEVKNNEDRLLDGETKIFKLLTGLEYEKHDALDNVVVLESKLIKLEISPE